MGGPTPTEPELHRICVTGIIWRKDPDGKHRFLITKRAGHKKVLPNKWHVPGGGLETKDYIHSEPTSYTEQSPQWYRAAEVALRRELKEEVGLTVTDIEYLLDVAFVRPDGIPVLVLSYYCKYESGEVVLDEDTTDYAWITAHEIAKYDFIQSVDEEILAVQARLI